MAASSLPEPGSELGPCLPSCKHVDCAATRAMAADRCPYCRQPIGYGRRFYELPGSSALAHASCHEAAIERGETLPS